MDDKKQPKVSNTEWGLIIGALLTVDLVQIGLDLLGIGLAFNWLIDIFVGMSFALYLTLRVEVYKDWAQIMALASSFVIDEATGGAAPMWFLDGIFAMLRSRKQEFLAQIPGGGIISSVIKK